MHGRVFAPPYRRIVPAGLNAGTIVMALAIIVAGVVSGWAWWPRAERKDGPETARIATVLQTVEITTYRNVLPKQAFRGGAVERIGDDLLVVTQGGTFWRVRRSIGGGLSAQRLRLEAPLGLETYRRDQPASQGDKPFRVTDLLLDTLSSPARVFVSHQHWDHEKRCVTMRVSSAPLQLDSTAATPEWKTEYESAPCLALTERYDPYETGGRMAWVGAHELLFTIGDHGFSGLDGTLGLAQDTTGSYGKTIRIDLCGNAAPFTMGHRNPQGLLVARDGRIWSTEHGPKGGDEINLLAESRNYGWPKVTYGAAYHLERWPIAPDARDHGEFEEPAYVFVPSVAISNLIQLGGTQFPRWSGDFLAGSLRGRSLFRVRTRGDRVSYVERITVGLAIRDLAEMPDGRVMAYDGDGAIAEVKLAAPDAGEVAFAACAQCHGPDRRGTSQGPSLRGIFDRTVATHPDFAYSAALRAKGGRWTEATLDAFLRDPHAFAPGTSMNFAGIKDATTRRLIIGRLANLDGSNIYDDDIGTDR